MRFPFKEQKAVHLALLFLQHNGGVMSVSRLMNLMYLAERETILKRRHPITHDLYMATSYNVYLSNTFNFIHNKTSNLWNRCISCDDNRSLSVKEDVNIDSLTNSEITIANEIFSRYKDINDLSAEQMAELFPEWLRIKNANSSEPEVIYVSDIMRAAGRSTDDTKHLLEQLGLKQ